MERGTVAEFRGEQMAKMGMKRKKGRVRKTKAHRELEKNYRIVLEQRDELFVKRSVLSNRVLALEDKKQELQNKVSELQVKIEELREDNEDLQYEADADDKYIATLEARYKQLLEMCKTLELENEQLQSAASMFAALYLLFEDGLTPIGKVKNFLEFCRKIGMNPEESLGRTQDATFVSASYLITLHFFGRLEMPTQVKKDPPSSAGKPQAL